MTGPVELDDLTPSERVMLAALQTVYDRSAEDSRPGGLPSRPRPREARTVAAQVIANWRRETEPKLDDVKIMYEGLQAVSADEWQPADEVSLGQVLEAVARAWIKVQGEA